MANPTEVAFDALREIYSETEPEADFDHMLENPEEYDRGWQTDYYLPSERQNEIVDKHCEKHSLNRRERAQVIMTAIVSYGPSSRKQ